MKAPSRSNPWSRQWIVFLAGALGLSLSLGFGQGRAGTLSRIRFISNAGNYVNDTIVNANTSPLAFTGTNDLVQPFLNAADSTVSLGYGSYYAISFRGFGAHVGAGTIAFTLDDTTEISLGVTFPDPQVASGEIARFELPNGDTVTVSATGLAEDRIRIVADGPGLTGDGTPDAFYSFNYLPDPRPKLTIAPSTPGQVTVSWTPAASGYVLQTELSLTPAGWINAPSGETNPVVLSSTAGTQFFRLIRP